MRQLRASRPSPAIIVAVLALVAALAGTAVAGPDATTSAVSKKKVKKIAKKQAKKQINELAPSLSVAHADTAGNADTLDNLDSTDLKAKCPPGTAGHAGACFETATRAAENFRIASRTCGTVDRRLPTFSELETFRRQPGILIADAPADQYELTSDLFDTDLMGGVVTPGVISIDDEGDAHDEGFSNARKFRCVAPRAN